MKLLPLKILFLSILVSGMLSIAHGQAPVKNYEAAWKKVAELQLNGLPASAMIELKKIYAQAKKDGQDAQVIRSVYFMSNFQSDTRENNESLSIAEIEKEILTSSEPAKSIFKSMLASF